jgi:hypothetical protein
MKRALLVGIDHYRGMPLTGCVADATEMAELLKRNSDDRMNYEVKLVTSTKGGDPITRTDLRRLLQKLFRDAKNMQLLFYFAGHGAESPWGSELVTQDYRQSRYGVSVNDIITLANASAAPEIVIILDSCYSGDIGDTPGFQMDALSPDFRFGRALLREGVTILAAARPREGAAEEDGHGSFTKLLLQGLEGAAADHLGNVTALSLYDFASRPFGAFEQRPMLKAHVNAPSVLRECTPAISQDLLMTLTRYFASPGIKLRLSPRYEGKRPIPRGKEPTPEQRAFDYFKLLRNAGMLSTEDNADLYFAAIKSKRVFLTPTGRYFWKIAKKEGI